MVKYVPNKGRIINQEIDETSTTKNLPLGTIVSAWDSSSDDLGEGKFIYALGLALTAVGSLVSLDEDMVSTLGVANGKYRVIGVSMSANVADQYGWYQIEGKAAVKALAAFADDADCYLTSTAGSIDDAVVTGDFIYGMKGASAVDTPSTGLAYVQLSGNIFSLDGDTLDDATFLGTVSIGESGSAGVINIYPATAASGSLGITVQDQTGDTAVTLDIDEHGQATVVNLPDAGSATTNLVQSTAALTLAEADILDGATVSTAEVNYLDLTGAVGIAESTKAMVLDANLHQDVVHTASLLLGATGATVAVSATAAELNTKELFVTMADVSTGSSVWIPCPVAGTISKIYTIINGTIATADALITAEINTVAVTDSTVTIAESGSAAGDVDVASPSAANVVAVGDSIELITNGASTNTIIATICVVITL